MGGGAIVSLDPAVSERALHYHGQTTFAVVLIALVAASGEYRSATLAIGPPLFHLLQW